MVPQEAPAFYKKDFKLHPVGTGPFIMAQWDQMKKITLVRNTHYWRQNIKGRMLPFLDAVEFYIKPNYTFSESDFLKGEFDIISANDSEYVRLSKTEGFAKKFQIKQYFQKLAVRFLAFSMNTNTILSKDTNLRRALSWNFNRPLLIKNSHGSSFNLAHSLVPPALLGTKPLNEAMYDPKQAAALIKKTNSKQLNHPLVVSSNLRSPALELFKKNAEALGLTIKMDIRNIRYYEHIITDHPDIFRVSFVPSYPDPEEYYMLFYSKSGPEINLTNYKNPEYDRILEQAIYEQNTSKRLLLFLKLEQILAQDIPAIYLFHNKPVYLITPRSIHGIKGRFLVLDYSEVWMENK